MNEGRPGGRSVRMAERLTTFSNPRFSLSDRTSGLIGSLDENSNKARFSVNFMPDRLQRHPDQQAADRPDHSQSSKHVKPQ